MPYTNEHAARQTDPALYDDFRRFKPKGADGVSMILGIKDDRSEIQSVRADADKLTPSQFREWLEAHDLDASTLEEATRKSFDAFSRWVPLELDPMSKGKDEEDDAPSKAMIGGICSTRDMDLEGETIEQDGLEWDYFLANGWFNHEHQQGAGAVLGHPVKIEQVDDDRTRVEGVLYLDKQLGRDVYETAVAMKKAGGDRSLGFSVEGQVLLRDPLKPKRVLKARVLNVAITAMPINPHTNLELIARSMGASIGYQEPVIPDADAAMSALVQQSLDRAVSSATYGDEPRVYTRDEVKELLRGKLGAADRELDELVDKLMKLAKNNTGVKL
jgi:hypothetical protein